MSRFHVLITLLSILFFTPQSLAIEVDNELPDSLGKWYKPENKRQVWLHTMFGMRREIQAVEEYVNQKNIDGINKWSERLITHYRKLPKMVPEWEDRLGMNVIDALEESVKNQELSSIRFNTRQLQKQCRSCHKKYRVLASLRYRSANFSELIISNQHKDYKYARFMKILSRSLNRIRIAAEDEYWLVASEASKKFQLELVMLGKNCVSCHKDDEPFQRVLGLSTQQAIKQMDAGIADQDTKAVKMSLGETAVKVCARCHAVHRTVSDIQRLLLTKDSEH